MLRNCPIVSLGTFTDVTLCPLTTLMDSQGRANPSASQIDFHIRCILKIAMPQPEEQKEKEING